MVNTEIRDRIAYVEMQNADHFNCLSEEMCTEHIAALDEAYASECVGIVLKAQASIARNHEPPAHTEKDCGTHHLICSPYERQ